MKTLDKKHIVSFNKTTGDTFETISLCKKTYLVTPSLSPIIMHKLFRESPPTSVIT